MYSKKGNIDFSEGDYVSDSPNNENGSLLFNNVHEIQELDNLTNVCRICAQVVDQSFPLFDEQGQCCDLVEKINKYLPIEVNQIDGMTQVICEQCRSTLLAWDELVRCCIQANVVLQQKQLNSVKSEQKEKAGSTESPTQIREILTEYFQQLCIEEENADLEYVCQMCAESPASKSVEELTAHLRSFHEHQLQNKEFIEDFIKDNITFEEILITDKFDNDLESLNNDTDSVPNANEANLQNYCCPFCESMFSSPSRLIYHLNKHIEVTFTNGTACCDQIYGNKLAFVTHLQKEHVSRICSDHICKSCGINKSTFEDLQAHINEEHRGSGDLNERKEILHVANRQKYITVVCPKCNKTLSNKYNLRVHMRSHTNTLTEFKCGKCNKAYKSQGSLSYHHKICHEGNLRYLCSLCGEAFPTRGTRDIHERIHTGVKPFECYHCGKCYRAKNTLDRHMDMHLDIRKHACNLCPKKFRKRAHLNYHIRTHDKKTPQRVSFEAYLLDQEENNLSDHKYDTGNESWQDVVSDDEDRPLAAIAKTKTNLYHNFYDALVNFRNHFVTEHDNKIVCSDFSDSSESEKAMENNSELMDLNGFDDLTNCNMRKDKMDEQTRTELSQVQSKINGKVYYTCKVCGKRLSSTHTYIFHKRIHTGERPCVCHICGKQFRTPNGLKRHVTETHEKQRWYTCIVCLKNFANSQNLKQHMRIHTGERPFVCPHCGKRFTQSGSLHVHLKTHSDHYPHQCADCGAKFRLRSGLTRHRLKHTGQRPHVCVYCGKGFRQKHELNSHILSHTDSKPHACSICGTAFRQRRALRHHCKRLHQNEVGDAPQMPLYNHVEQFEGYQTSICVKNKNNKTTELDSLCDLETKSIEHPEHIVTKDGKKYGICDVCKKNIAIASLRRHLRSHSTVKIYSCDICGLGYKDSGNLSRHRRAKHAAQRPHTCDICHKAFTRNDHLQEHINIHYETRNYICDICGKASKSSSGLRVHRRIHANDYRFRCVYCESKFKRKSELLVHVSVHTGQKSHLCGCGKAFRLQSQLTNHTRTHIKQIERMSGQLELL